ncbi:MAG: type II toxin-antitoxin system RelE/ParE family toxin [Thermotogae bacterium]|nr:type II toxin-antitoxin system RelE/ParE family toxin [Thermotogota bacterium]
MKSLDKLDPATKNRIISAVSNLPHGDIKSLSGNLKGYLRLRVGNWRVIFKRRGQDFIIVDVRHRGSAY